MEKKTSKARNFLKKNVYYIIMAICLLAIAAMITVTVLIGNGVIAGSDNLNQSNDTPAIQTGDQNIDKTEPQKTDTPKEEKPTETPKEDKPTEKPVEEQPTAIVFATPVDNVNIVQGYSMDALVWNATLKHYAVHNGIDFGGTDGDNVMAAYDGVVDSVTYDVLNGNTVTIKHKNDITTVYSSLNEPTVAVGQTVKKGDVIGTMGTTATAEYSLGAHVHFTVMEKGNVIDPDIYMTISSQK